MSTQSARSPLTATELVDEYFIETRNRIIEVAAFLDRIDRADPACAVEDFRLRAFVDALAALTEPAGPGRERIVAVQEIFSDPTTEPRDALDRKGAVGAFDSGGGGGRP